MDEVREDILRQRPKPLMDIVRVCESVQSDSLLGGMKELTDLLQVHGIDVDDVRLVDIAAKGYESVTDSIFAYGKPPYLIVTPKQIFLWLDNNYQDDVDVLSNVQWNVG